MDNLIYRSEYLHKVLQRHNIPKSASILEIGHGDGRNIKFLKEKGYVNVTGIDKLEGTSIETVFPTHYDVIYTMSCLFLIPLESEWVLEKIAGMADKWLITVEGETTWPSLNLIGRDYAQVFKPYGFEQIEHKENVFNRTGVLRVLKRKQ